MGKYLTRIKEIAGDAETQPEAEAVPQNNSVGFVSSAAGGFCRKNWPGEEPPKLTELFPHSEGAAAKEPPTPVKPASVANPEAASSATKPRELPLRLRQDHARWAEAMFRQHWSDLAIAFEWSDADIRALAAWLGVRVVRALGPEHAVAEDGEAFDRVTRKTWNNPYHGE
jgi:hypothetical protein